MGSWFRKIKEIPGRERSGKRGNRDQQITHSVRRRHRSAHKVSENYSLQESQVNAAHARFLGRHCQDADVCRLLACNIEFTRNAYVIEVRISSKENYQRCHKKVLDDVRSVKNSDVLTEGLLFRGGCHPASSGIG